MAAFLWNLTGCNAENFFSSSQEQEETISVASEYGHELDPEIHQLVADSNYKVVDQNDGILFETALTEEEATSGAEVVLLDSSHQKKATLYDDGTHGDRIANDRIYTCNYKPEITNETEITCWATVGDIETEPVTIQYFDRLTENDFEEASKIGTMFSETVTEYTDAEGYIQEEYQNDALQKAGVLAETLDFLGN
ncbi:MAG: hypothetical protein E7496_10415 [Ruminococcus sp.]|nr:hypothetical protein [Ruminococcus sp.]